MFTNLPIIWGPHILGIEHHPFIDDFPIETSTSFFFAGSHIYIYILSNITTLNSGGPRYMNMSICPEG